MFNNAAHFIIDSEHVRDIQSRLYGFAVTKQGMITNSVPPTADLTDASGAWVLIKRTDEHIEITQDSMGCFGLFLFREGDYWALSNSFNHFVDFLKADHKLSLNKDYIDAYLTAPLHINTYGETVIREISWLDRRAQLFINPHTSEMTMKLRPLDEHTINIETEDGLRILDAWHDKWASVVRGAARSWQGIIRADISGGFDTRMVLVPILSSGIDLSRIIFNSHHSKPYYKEDFKIATQLAQEYGFHLNKEPENQPMLPPVESFTERALSTIFFEKEIYTKPNSQGEIPKIVFNGFGGERMRPMGGNRFFEDYMRGLSSTIEKTKKDAPESPQVATLEGIRAIMQRSFDGIDATYRKTVRGYNGSLDNGQASTETDNRSHFGMSIARTSLSHAYFFTPLSDPLLLKLYCDNQQHPLLIIALILSRYHPELARIPFDKTKHIPTETLSYAEELNERFPRTIASAAQIASTDLVTQSYEPLYVADDTTIGLEPPMEEQLTQALESPVVYYHLSEFYGKTAMAWTIPQSKSRHSNVNKYAAVALAKVASDAKNGKNTPKDFATFIKSCCQPVTFAGNAQETDNNS